MIFHFLTNPYSYEGITFTEIVRKIMQNDPFYHGSKNAASYMVYFRNLAISRYGHRGIKLADINIRGETIEEQCKNFLWSLVNSDIMTREI